MYTPHNNAIQIWILGYQVKIDPKSMYKVWNKNIDLNIPCLSEMIGEEIIKHLKAKTGKFELGATDFSSYEDQQVKEDPE